MSVRIGPLSIMSILNEPILIFISHKRWPKYDKHPFRKRVGACPVYVGQTQRNKRFKSYPTKTLTKIETYRIQRSISLVPVLCKHAHSSPNGQERDVNSYGRVLGSSWLSFIPRILASSKTSTCRTRGPWYEFALVWVLHNVQLNFPKYWRALLQLKIR